MIRNIVIKAGTEQIVMRLRAQPFATPSQVLAAMNACLDDFKAENPEKYKVMAADGTYGYACLFTHVPPALLDRHGLDIIDCGSIWLEIDNDMNNI